MTPDEYRFWAIIQFNYTPQEVIYLDREFTVDIRYRGLTPAQIAKVRWIEAENYDGS